MPSTIDVSNQLRKLGVPISRDDFGAGHSSLGYLKKFSFDKIKIDRSFIHDLADRPESITIVRAIAGLGSALGITTTAEGGATVDQLLRLRTEGRPEIQGYLLREPRPIKDLEYLVNDTPMRVVEK